MPWPSALTRYELEPVHIGMHVAGKVFSRTLCGLVVVAVTCYVTLTVIFSDSVSDHRPTTRRWIQRTMNRSAVPTTLSDGLTCDTECLRFRSLVDSWPTDKPRAAIILLIQQMSLPFFNRSVRFLDANFNDRFNYPIVLFHEDEDVNATHRQQLRSMTHSNVFFQPVRFEIPAFLNRSAVGETVCFKTVGYRHMCRFHAKSVYDQLILADLLYVWRLDDDSYITRPIAYDVFRLMRDRKLLYGYAAKVPEYEPCIVGLWPAADGYAKRKGITAKFHWSRSHIFYTNFEISRLALWRSAEYKDFIDFVDRLGGIYYHRWGDAPIKTVALTLFVSEERIHHFNDLAYSHGRAIELPAL